MARLTKFHRQQADRWGPAVSERERGSWAAGGDWADTRKRKRVRLGWNKGEKRGIGRYVWDDFRDFCDFENHTSTKTMQRI
jgi:hypothetical protein